MSARWAVLRDKLNHALDKLHDFFQLNGELGEDYGTEFAFRQFDEDGGGTLGREEVIAAFKTLGIPLNSEEIAIVLNKMDPNHDNVISLEEFENTIRRRPKGHSCGGNVYTLACESVEVNRIQQLEAQQHEQRRVRSEQERLAWLERGQNERDAANAKRMERIHAMQKESKSRAEAHANKLKRAREMRMQGTNIRLKKPKPIFRLGQLIEAYASYDRNFYPGKVVGINSNGTYNVELNERGRKVRYVGLRESMVRSGPHTLVMEKLRQEFERGSLLRTPPNRPKKVLWPRTTAVQWDNPKTIKCINKWNF